VREAVIVTVAASGFEGATICCAYVPADDEHAAPIQVRTELSRALPGYMLPTRWEQVTSLPRNANGKIDRSQVKADFERAAGLPDPVAAAAEGSSLNVSPTG
jgi:acyl-coenzyme A synthetase/AMP-(fatty) acid ligase